MSDPNRIRRQQILKEAEGYLDLICVFGDSMPCRPDARNRLARRVLSTLAVVRSWSVISLRRSCASGTYTVGFGTSPGIT